MGKKKTGRFCAEIPRNHELTFFSCSREQTALKKMHYFCAIIFKIKILWQ